MLMPLMNPTSSIPKQKAKDDNQQQDAGYQSTCDTCQSCGVSMSGAWTPCRQVTNFKSRWKVPITIAKFQGSLSTVPLRQEADEKEGPAKGEGSFIGIRACKLHDHLPANICAICSLVALSRGANSIGHLLVLWGDCGVIVAPLTEQRDDRRKLALLVESLREAGGNKARLECSSASHNVLLQHEKLLV
jgi:hypothetical protein